MPHLFDPYRIGELALSNRIAIAPMCQYSAEQGSATDWHMIHLGSLALSGAGLMIVEATAVSPEGRISPADLGLYSDANEAALDAGVATGVQFNHVSRDELNTAIARTIALHATPDRWAMIQRRGMRSDFSWAKSGLRYAQLYRGLCTE